MGKTKDLALAEQEGKAAPKKVTKPVTKQFILLELEFRKELVEFLGKLPTEQAGRFYFALLQAKPQDLTFSNNGGEA